MKKGKLYFNIHKYCECDSCKKRRLLMFLYTCYFYDSEGYSDSYTQIICLFCKLRYEYYNIKSSIKRFVKRVKEALFMRYYYKIPFRMAFKSYK